jgi:hypothetical protein
MGVKKIAFAEVKRIKRSCHCGYFAAVYNPVSRRTLYRAEEVSR